MMNQCVDRVVAGLGIVFQQWAQQRQFRQLDSGRLDMEFTPPLTQVVESRCRYVRSRVEFSRPLSTVSIEVQA